MSQLGIFEIELPPNQEQSLFCLNLSVCDAAISIIAVDPWKDWIASRKQNFPLVFCVDDS